MYIKESVFKLAIIVSLLVFSSGLFLTVRFIKRELSLATNPSSEVVKGNSTNFDQKTYEAVLKKLSK